MALAPRVFLTAEQIQNRVRQMGEEISANYPEGPLYLISILKGAFMFLADLSRHIQTPSRIEFMGISSYGRGKTSSGEVKEIKFRPKIEDHDFDTKVGHIKRFLSEGNKVKLTMMFRGREITHSEIAKAVLDKVAIQLAETVNVEQNPRLRWFQHRRLAGFHDVLRAAHRGRRVDRNDLADDQPIKQMAQRRELLLDARR